MAVKFVLGTMRLEVPATPQETSIAPIRSSARIQDVELNFSPMISNRITASERQKGAVVFFLQTHEIPVTTVAASFWEVELRRADIQFHSVKIGMPRWRGLYGIKKKRSTTHSSRISSIRRHSTILKLFLWLVETQSRPLGASIHLQIALSCTTPQLATRILSIHQWLMMMPPVSYRHSW